MPTPAYVIDEMISAKSIAARVEALAREIQQAFKDTDKLIVIGLLRGSFVFIADLVRELDLPVEVDFLETSSYGEGMESSREVLACADERLVRHVGGRMDIDLFFHGLLSRGRADHVEHPFQLSGFHIGKKR